MKGLATYTLGYYSNGVAPSATVDAAFTSHPTQLAHGVVTPHASFLALRYAPHEAVANLRLLSEKFPTIYGPLGFQDSVDVTAGVVSSGILTLDQGMIMAAVANALADDAIRHAFSDGRIEQAVRPLIAAEEFDAGPLAQNLAVAPIDNAAGASRTGSKAAPSSRAAKKKLDRQQARWVAGSADPGTVREQKRDVPTAGSAPSAGH